MFVGLPVYQNNFADKGKLWRAYRPFFTQERLSFGRGAQAANDGLGIAMGISTYIDEDIDAGRLVAPFDLSIPRGAKQGKAYRPPSANLASFRALRRWIIRTALLSRSPSTPAAA